MLKLFVCVQGDIHITVNVIIIVPHNENRTKESFLYNLSVHIVIQNIKPKALQHFFFLLACLQLPQYWQPVNSKSKKNSIADNHLELSFHFSVDKCGIEAARGRKWPGGGGEEERERQSNHSFGKTFVFSEKGQFSS